MANLDESVGRSGLRLGAKLPTLNESPGFKWKRYRMNGKGIDNLQPGEIINERFEIIKSLGTSPVGAAYLAFLIDKGKASKVVLKVISRYRVSDIVLFRQQVDEASALKHPNIVSLLGFISGDETVGYASRYFDGFSLDERLRAQRAVSLKEGLNLLAPICYGLAAMHEAGIVHGNLSPRNVLLTLEGEVGLVDYGFQLKGRCCDFQELLSPEFRANGCWDKRSDVYSVAALMYVLVAFEKVAPGAKSNFIDQLKRGKPHRPLLEVNPDCPPALGKIIMRALSLNPDERQQNASEFLDELCCESLALPDPFSADSSRSSLRVRLERVKNLVSGASLAPTSRTLHYKGKKLSAAPKESDGYYGHESPLQSNPLVLLFLIGIVVASFVAFRSFSKRYNERTSNVDPLQMLDRGTGDPSEAPKLPVNFTPPPGKEGGYYLYIGIGRYRYVDKDGKVGEIINPSYSPPEAR
jgi:serine/threonine protein kinase